MRTVPWHTVLGLVHTTIRVHIMIVLRGSDDGAHDLRRQLDMSPRPRRSVDKSTSTSAPSCLPLPACLPQQAARPAPATTPGLRRPSCAAPRPGETCLPARPMATGQAASRAANQRRPRFRSPPYCVSRQGWINLLIRGRAVVLSMDPSPIN